MDFLRKHARDTTKELQAALIIRRSGSTFHSPAFLLSSPYKKNLKIRIGFPLQKKKHLHPAQAVSPYSPYENPFKKGPRLPE